MRTIDRITYPKADIKSEQGIHKSNPIIPRIRLTLEITEREQTIKIQLNELMSASDIHDRYQNALRLIEQTLQIAFFPNETEIKNFIKSEGKE